MQEPYGKGDSDSILASSLAGGIVRCRLKRRQRYQWAGLLSFEKWLNQDADSMVMRRKAIRQSRYTRAAVRSCVVEEPGHAEKQDAREPGNLQHARVFGSRPVREGHKPNDGHARAGEVRLCPSTCEPAEQGRETFCGGWGGKGMDRGEHFLSHMLPTQSGAPHVPSLWSVRLAASAVCIHDKSRMRRRARTDLCGGRSMRIVPTAIETRSCINRRAHR